MVAIGDLELDSCKLSKSRDRRCGRIGRWNKRNQYPDIVRLRVRYDLGRAYM